MKDLLSSLSSVFDDQTIGTMSRQIDATPQQTRTAVQAALPLLMGMMANNCQSKQGCESLARAVDSDHDGGILNQLQGFLQRGDVSEGEGILKHLFGSSQAPAEQQLASTTGLQKNQIHTLLGLLAPIVLGALGRQARAQGEVNGATIGNLVQGALAGLLQGSGGQTGGGILGGLLGGQGTDLGQLARTGSTLLGGLFKKA